MTNKKGEMRGEKKNFHTQPLGFSKQFMKLVGHAMIQEQRAVGSRGATDFTEISASANQGFNNQTQACNSAQSNGKQQQQQTTWRIATHRREFKDI